MSMQLGYTMMTEQAGPKDLVSHVVGAEEVGFDALWISDHYHPWVDAQGHSVDIGGYYRPDADKVSTVMRPSTTFNEIIAALP